MREHRGAVEADFHNYYGTEDFDDALEERGVRWIYVRVKHLPPDAALWRVQEPKESESADPRRTVTNDPNKIAAFFQRHISG